MFKPLIRAAAKKGNSCQMDMIEFCKLVIIQTYLQEFKMARGVPFRVSFRQVIDLLFYSVHKGLSLKYWFVRKACLLEFGSGVDWAMDVGDELSYLQGAWRVCGCNFVSIHNVGLLLLHGGVAGRRSFHGAVLG